MTLFRLDTLLPYSFKLRVIHKTSLEVREPRPFVITRFKIVVPSLLSCSRRREMRLLGCEIGFANSPTAHIMLSSVTSRFHQATLNAALPYGMRSPSIINIFAAYKICIFLKNKISRFSCIVGLFCIFITGI
jgi:xanthine/uracil/vitamin C permease (AzgA family)